MPSCARPARARIARAAAVLAVSALPLGAAGVAQAAVAGGNPATSSALPDMRSATILDSADVQVCFDKALSQSSAVLTTSSDMVLLGYSTGSNELSPIGATLDAKNNDCVDLAFNTHSGSLDLGQFTAVAAQYGAVQSAASGGQVNWSDSTTLLNATTHNGTVGLTVAPDLVGPAAVPVSSSTPNDIAFVFDQSVDPAAVTSQDFWYENANGQICHADPGAPVAVSGSTVVVQFPTVPTGLTGGGANCADTIDGNGTSSVSNARRAGVTSDAVESVSSNPVTNDEQGTNMPNAANGGVTNIASLVSATLGPENGQVTYTFDHPVDAALTNVNHFFVVLSDGNVIQGNGSSSTPDTVSGGSSANQVVVTYNNDGLQYFDEYAVQAGVDNGAVEATNHSTGADAAGTTFTNSPGAAPIGGNAGAFARGFTTGPDMYAVAFDSTHDVAVASFDQRVAGTFWAPSGTGPIFGSNAYHIQFLNAAGNDLGGPRSVVVPTFPNPGPVSISMSVDPAIMAQHPTQIALDLYAAAPGSNPNESICAFYTGLAATGDFSGCSIPQIVSATTAAGRLAPIHLAVKGHRAHGKHRRHTAGRSHHQH